MEDTKYPCACFDCTCGNEVSDEETLCEECWGGHNEFDYSDNEQFM
jgi:hypothetical protein